MVWIMILVVLGSAIWVYVDASKLRNSTENPNTGSESALEPIPWAIFTILFWIIAFPAYLLKRRANGVPPVGKKGWLIRGAIAISLLALLWIFVWSKPPIPECGDDDAIGTLKAAIQENVVNAIGSRIIHIGGERVAVSEIETLSKNKEVLKNTCLANISWILSPSVLEVANKIRNESYDINTDEMSIILSLASGEIDENKAQTLTNELVDFYSRGGSGLYKNQARGASGLIRSAELILPGIDNATVDLSKNKTKYIVRKNEDKTGGSYIVETFINPPIINSISSLELLGAAYELGKVRLASLPKAKPFEETPSSGQPSKAPVVSVPTDSNNVSTTLTQSLPPANPVAAGADVAFTPSFNCAKASSGIEKLICSDKDLAKIDVELNTAYMKARETSSNPKQLQTDQIAWIKSSRNACSDKTCLINAYKQRISEVSK